MRYKEFNTQRVLEDCITLFWEHGFGACAIKDIVSKTNVNRFSLYEEFENKEGLLLHSLELYQNRYSDKQQELLNNDKPVKTVLREFFISFLSDSNTHPPGDFVLHISTELADNNESIKNTLDNYLKSLKRKFEHLLKKHNDTSINSNFIAKHLVGLFCTSMCFCVIHSYNERISMLENGLDLILTKNTPHAKSA